MSRDLSFYTNELRAVFQGRLETHYPLAPHTIYQIGGPADLALFPEDAASFATLLTKLVELGLPWFVFGGGSNVLVSDRGFRGAAVFTECLQGIAVHDTRLVVEAGVTSHRVAQSAQAHGLSGAEFLAWLPGSIGGACWMNARAYGSEISAIITAARVVTSEGILRKETLAKEQFAYKNSPFQKHGCMVAEATFELEHGDRKTIQEAMDRIGESRRLKREMDYPSCGCVFKNDYSIGVPAGRLIDSCGLKGWRVGNAQVAPFHGNFILNLGEATAEEVLAVIEHVRKTVLDKRGYYLELEVQLVGEWA